MTTAKLLNPDDVGDDVIVVGGQSNASGYGTPLDVANFDPPNPRIWQFANANSNPTNGNKKIVGIDPMWFYESAHQNQVGPAMPFARWYLQTIPTNRNVLLVPAACGGTGFTTSSLVSPPAGFVSKPLGGCWLVGGDGGGGVNLYQLAVNQTNAALALNPNNRITAIMWVQGEDDAQDNMLASAYQTALDALFTALRANIPGASNVPIIVGQMNPDAINSGALGADGPLINAVHIDTPRRTVRVGFSYGPSGMTDAVFTPLHYSAAGQRLIGGTNMPAAFLRAKANVLGTAPIAPGAPVLTQTGTTVNIKWPQPTCRMTDFTAQYQDNGGSFSTITRTIPNIDVTAQLTGMTLGHTIGVKVSTTNEAGTSGYSPVGSLVLQTIPAQVTGLTATPDATTAKVALAWTAIANATGGYQVNYRVTGAGSWTSFGIVHTNSCTILQLISSTGYDFQVAAINNAGQGTFSATANATTPAVTAPIQAVGVTAWRAYGLRQLSSTYGGNAILVRRSSDNTTLAIGFTGTGDLNTAALLAFCAATNGFVVTWYDQSGSGFDMTQATTTKQVQIVTAGALTVTVGGKPAAQGSTTTGYIDTHTGLVAAGAASALCVFNSVGAPAGNTEAFGEYGTTFYNMLALQVAAWGAVLGFTGGNILASVTPALAAGPYQYSIVDTGTNASNWLDGTLVKSTTYSRAGLTFTDTGFAFFTNSTSAGTLSSNFTGSIAELIVYEAALTTFQRQAGENNQNAYYGT